MGITDKLKSYILPRTEQQFKQDHTVPKTKKGKHQHRKPQKYPSRLQEDLGKVGRAIGGTLKAGQDAMVKHQKWVKETNDKGGLWASKGIKPSTPPQSRYMNPEVAERGSPNPLSPESNFDGVDWEGVAVGGASRAPAPQRSPQSPGRMISIDDMMGSSGSGGQPIDMDDFMGVPKGGSGRPARSMSSATRDIVGSGNGHGRNVNVGQLTDDLLGSGGSRPVNMNRMTTDMLGSQGAPRKSMDMGSMTDDLLLGGSRPRLSVPVKKNSPPRSNPKRKPSPRKSLKRSRTR